MKKTTFFIALFYSLALQNGLSQNTSKNLLASRFGSGEAGDGVWLGASAPHALYLFTDSGKASVTIQPSGKVDFANSIKVNGTTTTQILTITGGADLAEPFPISEPDSILPGAVVVIDEQNPGKLKLCRHAYDTRVAGVVSGAGGVNAGLTLKQNGRLEDGRNIALNGRVYVLATAANGSIKPGDLLTTSETAGHAMKATDRVSSYGAVIGKALTALDAGEGLVLVLVNLQ